MTPSQAADTVRSSFAAQSDGKVGVVSLPGISVLGALTFQDIAGSVVDFFAPNEFNVPGTAPLARGLGKAAEKIGNTTANSIKRVTSSVTNITDSAASGVKSGFKIGVLILVLIAGLWVWAAIRPPR